MTKEEGNYFYNSRKLLQKSPDKVTEEESIRIANMLIRNEIFEKPFSSLSCYKTSYKELQIGNFEFFDKDGKSLKVYKIYNSKYGVGIKKARSFTVFNTELK